MTSPARLLLIDDDPVLCRVVSRLVRSQYEVTSGQSVAEAQEILANGPYDLLLLDFRLPDGTGLDVCEAARAQGVAAPALLMSGYDAATVAPEASRCGVTGFITKPFNEADLLKSLDDALARGAAQPAPEPLAPATATFPATSAVAPSLEEKKDDASEASRFPWPWRRPSRKAG